MSRIYVIRGRKSGSFERYVRAHTLNGAIRAHAAEVFEAKAATTDELFVAAQAGTFHVLDALEPIHLDIDDKDDPGPVPLRAVT